MLFTHFMYLSLKAHLRQHPKIHWFFVTKNVDSMSAVVELIHNEIPRPPGLITYCNSMNASSCVSGMVGRWFSDLYEIPIAFDLPLHIHFAENAPVDLGEYKHRIPPSIAPYCTILPLLSGE